MPIQTQKSTQESPKTSETKSPETSGKSSESKKANTLPPDLVELYKHEFDDWTEVDEKLAEAFGF